MDRTRIRWRNVGRLAAGLGTGGLLLAVVPGLLTPPDPAPLPPDVGLETGATGAYVSVAGSRESERGHGNPGEARHRRDREPADRKTETDLSRQPPRHHGDRRRPPIPAASAAPPPGPTTPVAAPQPVLAPAGATASAPLTASPSPPPTAPAPAGDDPGGPGPSPDQPPTQVPSQFGFEH